MRRFLRSKLFLTLIAFGMIAAVVVIPLSVNIARSHAASTTTILKEDFESGAPGWMTTGFWHIQDHPESFSVKSPDINPNLVTLPDSGQLPAAFNGTHAAWFGEASTGTFCGSDFNTITQAPKDGCTSTQVHSGELTSPTFSLAGATSAEVQFQAWWEIESVNADTFDLMTVEYTIDGGVSWQQAGKLNPVNNPAGKHDQDYTANGIEKPAQWNQDIVDLSGAAGQSSVQIRFKFNTVDDLYQGFRGWLVDNVVVSTPFVSPNPSIASLNPACVSSSASLPVTITGSNFVSGSKVLLDSNDIGGAVLSAQTIEFTANNLAVGNHSVQVVSPNGAKSNTATLTSALSCTSPKKTLFVFVQGIDSKLGPGINNPFFDKNGIQQFLAKNYPQAAFLNFSYAGSNSTTGQPNTYGCVDTFSQNVSNYVSLLAVQLRHYLIANPSISSVYLVGHSMGGVVSFGYLAFLDTTPGGLKGTIPGTNAHLKGVVTLDSPLGGVEGGFNGVYEFLTLSFYYYKNCTGLQGANHFSLDDLTRLFTSLNPRGGQSSIYKLLFGTNRNNQNLAQEAHADGINTLTVGNFDDYVYAPQECVPEQIFGPAFRNSQYLKDQGNTSGVYGRQIVTGIFPCSSSQNPFVSIAKLAENHGDVLFDLSVKLGIQQFVNGQPLTALAPPA